MMPETELRHDAVADMPATMMLLIDRPPGIGAPPTTPHGEAERHDQQKRHRRKLPPPNWRGRWR